MRKENPYSDLKHNAISCDNFIKLSKRSFNKACVGHCLVRKQNISVSFCKGCKDFKSRFDWRKINEKVKESQLRDNNKK